jgi:hypothetical protein
MQSQGKLEAKQALLAAYSESNESSIEQGKAKLLTDGALFDNREALAIGRIYQFCEANLSEPEFDWVAMMNPRSSDPVMGFSEEELAAHEDSNAAARSFVIENLFNVLFPEEAGRFK